MVAQALQQVSPIKRLANELGRRAGEGLKIAQPSRLVPSIKQLATELIAWKTATGYGATVLLGPRASCRSGIPSWPDLAARVCQKLRIPADQASPVNALSSSLRHSQVAYSQVHTVLQELLRDKTPSLGYAHLAQLVKDGLISTVLTTGWDSMLERAILRLVPYGHFRVLVRGEMPDTAVAEALEWRKNLPTVVKLQGDLQTRLFLLGEAGPRRFQAELGKCLTEVTSGCTYVAGQSAHDSSVLSAILNARGNAGKLYHVRHPLTPGDIDRTLERAQAVVMKGIQPSVVAAGEDVNVGDFDSFFTQLNLAAQQELQRFSLE